MLSLPCFYKLTEEIKEGSAVYGLRKKKNAVEKFLRTSQRNSKTGDYLGVTFIKWS